VPRIQVLRDGANAFAGPLDARFWKRFARDHWEQSPARLDGAVAPAFVRPDDLFAALVSVADAYRADERTAQFPEQRAVRVRFNVDDATRLAGAGRHLPAAADGSLAGYVERIASELGDRRFELIVHDVQAYDVGLWMRARRFLRGLLAEIGVPVDEAEAVVFVRNHEATSFGVHRDMASVFMLPVQGRKRLLAWPPTQAFRFCTPEYEDRRADAVALDVGPGDVAYWPSSHWHVGESVDPWSASVSLGIRLRRPPAADIGREVVRLLDKRLPPARSPTSPFEPELPSSIRAALSELSETCAGGALELALQESWLKRMTAYGFARVPPPLPVRRIDDAEVVSGSHEDPVVWASRGDGKLLCSAHGHAFSLPESAAPVALFERLNTGDPWRAGELLATCAALGERRHVLRGVLNELVRLRAVTAREESPWGTMSVGTRTRTPGDWAS
jgi:50S ribosomal protein L16 3-hydroxylase